MKRAILIPALFVGLLAIRANAGEPKPKVQPEPQPPSQEKEDKTAAEGAASDKPLPEPTEPVVPKRELVFEESDRKYPVKLISTDAKLLEQRYAAVFRIFADGTGPKAAKGDLASLYHAATFGGAPPDWFGNLAGNVPKQRLPSKDVLSILTKDALRYVTRRAGNLRGGPDDLGDIEFIVRAPTPELVKELVTGMFQLYDYGLSYPIQEGYLDLLRDYERELPGARTRLKQANEELAELERQLGAYQEYEDITE